MTLDVPALRIRRCNDAPTREGAGYVLYWMVAQRRTRYHFGLQRAVEWARHLGLPLVVFEPLRAGYEWASDRFHAFVLEGMIDNARACDAAGVTYFPYVEPEAGAGKGLLKALAGDAAVVVTDLFPCFFIPRMVTAAAEQLDVRVEAVDSVGMLPLAATETTFPTAYAFRRFLQKNLPPHLEEVPLAEPLDADGLPSRIAAIDDTVMKRWPPCAAVLDAVPRHDRNEDAVAELLSALPIDHTVRVVSRERGGAEAATERLNVFLDERLARYADDRNQPQDAVASELSAALHFGHISIHEVFERLAERESWTPRDLSSDTAGKRSGWWGRSPSAEAFLDEAITWREIGHNFCWHRPDDYDALASLPDWARKTIAEHADDPRETLYTLEQLDAGQTHDDLWNAAQGQLVAEGRIHNYLRMLWGKNVIAWTRSVGEARDVLIELNNRYALDGRDPNSYSGIFWVLGRYDRAWGPERPIYGKLRYMTSANTKRKVKVREYIERYSKPSLFDA